MYGELYTTYDEVTYEIKRKTDKVVSETYYSKIGDVIIPTSGETPEEIATATCVMLPGVILAGDLNIYRTNIIDGRIVSFIINHVINNKISKVAQGKSVVHVKAEEIGKISINYPNAKEQKKILSFLELLDKKIDKQKQLVESLKSYKRGALSKLFPQNGETTPQYRFAGFTDVWEQYKLGDIGETYTGLSGKTKEDFGHGNAKFVTYLNVFSNPIADSTMTEAVEIDKKQNGVKYGDIFFTTSSETPDEVGMSSVWLENSDNTYLNSFCFGYRLNTEINRFYIAYMLRSETVRKNIIFLAQGISRYNISKNKMMEISIPFPTLDEQQKIGDYFLNLDRLITLHQRKLNEFETVKAGLLQQLFI